MNPQVPYYETERGLAEYLLFHYGAPEQLMPHAFGPSTALDFPVRCVTECLSIERLPASARALDLGCAVGRSTFELARFCAEVIGIDSSETFIRTARLLRKNGKMDFCYIEEGDLGVSTAACVPSDIDRARTRFEQGDAHDVPAHLGSFDVVLMANLIDRLNHPQRCLGQLRALVRTGGQLIITSPYTWLAEFTPRENWLGGFERDGKPVKTFDTLKTMLAPHFELCSRKNMSFLIREHARKFQWSVAEASMWVRKK